MASESITTSMPESTGRRQRPAAVVLSLFDDDGDRPAGQRHQRVLPFFGSEIFGVWDLGLRSRAKVYVLGAVPLLTATVTVASVAPAATFNSGI